MAVSIPKTASCLSSCTNDTTPPPKPRIEISIASEGIGPKSGKFRPTPRPQPQPRPQNWAPYRDPAYIELSNFEPGATIEMVITSNNPTGSVPDAFKDNNRRLCFKPTGLDVEARIASLYLNNEQMEALELQSGDEYWLRVVDPAGNPSDAVRGVLNGEPPNNSLTRRGTLNVKPTSENAQSRFSAFQINALDGTSRRRIIFKTMEDTTPPTVRHFRDKALFLTAPTGEVTLSGNQLLEGGANVTLHNLRTNQRQSGGVALNSRALSIPLGANTKTGDTFVVEVRDPQGNSAQLFEMLYNQDCDRGIGKTLNVLNTQISESIKIPD